MEKWIETTDNIWVCTIISSHYERSLEVYLDLFAEAKKDFDHLTYQDVTCLVKCKGYALLSFQIPSNSDIPEGWTASDNIDKLRR